MAEQKGFRVELEPGTWAATLGLLVQKGLRLGSFIDIGSADGYFGLASWRGGLLRGVTVVNIDANPVYEPSLRKIRDAIGGYYRICAIDEKSGTLEMNVGAHPYWGSAAAPDDPYWVTINQQAGETVSVPCRTLDSLVEELKLTPPYALKLDIQGFEARALRSGARALKDTAVVICEVIVHNFREVNEVLQAAGFDLHDLTDVHRTADHNMGWFYASYLHRDYASLRPQAHWDPSANAEMLEEQNRRRAQLIGRIDNLVAKINAEKA